MVDSTGVIEEKQSEANVPKMKRRESVLS